MPRNSSTALIIFIKNPIEGKVKTRISASVGDELALEIYLKLCDYTKDICIESGLDAYLFYSDFIESSDGWSPALFEKKVQEGNDLGDRMFNALHYCLTHHQNAILIGTDCPLITKKHLLRASRLLESNDVVIGPSIDGGYYLIGMRKAHSSLFTSIKWSTENVLTQTLTKCTEAQLRYTMLEPLSDVDHLEDWEKYGW